MKTLHKWVCDDPERCLYCGELAEDYFLREFKLRVALDKARGE